MTKFKSGPADGLCVVCRREIPMGRWGHGSHTCSRGCANKYKHIRYTQLNAPPGHWSGKLCSGKVGAIHEMIACAELLKQGISIFRAVSPSEICDLIGMRGGAVKRIEVTTAFRTPSGKLTHAKAKEKAKFDLLVMIEKSGAIHYEPPVDQVFPASPESV